MAGTLSSIKPMFGLINHDTARSLCGGRSITCPRQLLFTFAAALQNITLGFHHHFETRHFALGSKCMAVNGHIFGLHRIHSQRHVPLLFMSETSG